MEPSEATIAQLQRLIRRRDAVLSALAEVARLLSVHREPLEQMSSFLAVLGQAVEVSRSYIFANTPTPAGWMMSQVAEWTSPGITPQIDNPALQRVYYGESGFERWERLLSQNQIIQGNIADFPPSEQEMLMAQHIRSLVVAPIFVGSTWWGFIGFDQCETTYVWDPVEIEALRSAAVIFGAALYRRQMERQILEAQQQALRELATPLIPITDEIVVMPLIGAIDDWRAQQVMQILLEGVARRKTRLVILDITGVPAVDIQVAQTLLQAAKAVKLLGARVMLTGVQPLLAETLIRLGVDLQDIQAQSSLQAGIAMALQHTF